MIETTETVVMPGTPPAILDDNIQHGIDDDPNMDGEKGAALGAFGGAVTGVIAGAAVGPVGVVVGGLVGGMAGAVAAGLGVAAVDRIDNDNNISGVGDGVTVEHDAVNGTSPTITVVR